jgi:tetratricopeptide (TPR) repeat protein
MPYDLFISYARRDNEQGRITQLVERIKADFANFEGNNGRELNPFFDKDEIHGMSDWRQRIFQGLRESRLLLACLSPAYLQSEYCEWEFVEYLKYEIGHLHGFNGVAPIYFVEVPGWDSKDFEQQCAAWVAELRKRQHFDLRPWHDLGEVALREAAMQERMGKLNHQIVQIITRGERAEKSLGNVDAHNPHFIGRTANLRMLRENFVKPGHIGVVTAVNGVGGLGKTALAIEYAHAFADEYGGGRWQVRCAGKDDLRLALAELATPIGFEFTDDEKKNADIQFERTRRELKKLADARAPHRCLLLLDNVDRPGLLDPAQVARLNGGDWLHVIATTRLGETELHGAHRDRSFLAIDELPLGDALALIESYQPDGRFRSEAECDAAREIVRLLGCFTLAVESAAVYLGQFANDVTCAAFLARLKKEGLEGLDTAAGQSSEGVLHGEKRLSATLQPTLDRLGAAEKQTLEFAALLPPDQVPLPWLRALVSKTFPEMEHDAEPGYPDPWKNVLRRLFSLRLLTPGDRPEIVRFHRMVAAILVAANIEAIKRAEVLDQFVVLRFIPHLRARGQLEEVRDLLASAPPLFSEVPLEKYEIASLIAFLPARLHCSGASGALAEVATFLADFSTFEIDLGARARLLSAALSYYRQQDADSEKPANQLAVLCRLGDVAVALGKLSTARKHFTDCLSIIARFSEMKPHDAPWECERWRFMLRLGMIAVTERDFGAAEQYISESLGIARRLAQAHPCDSEMQQQVASSEVEMGHVLMAIGDTNGARRHFQESHRITRTLAEAGPSNTRRRELGMSLENLSGIALADGDLSTARLHLEAALELNRENAREAPPDPRRQRDVATSLQKLCDVATRAEDFSAARQHIDKSLDIVRSLSESDPKNAEFKADMMYCFQRLGDIAERTSNLPSALENWEAALAVSRVLASIDSHHISHQENLAISLFHTGRIMACLGSEPEGRKMAIQAAEILNRLEAAGQLGASTPAAQLFAHIRRLGI